MIDGEQKQDNLIMKDRGMQNNFKIMDGEQEHDNFKMVDRKPGEDNFKLMV